jgi:hypothetical protein
MAADYTTFSVWSRSHARVGGQEQSLARGKADEEDYWDNIFASGFSCTIALTANDQSGQPMKASVKGGI